MWPTLTALAVWTIGASASNGVDLSAPAQSDTFDCLKAHNYSQFVIVRAYRSLGMVDTSAPATIHAATAAGIKDLSVYMFPCVPTSAYSVSNGIECLAADAQVDSMIDFLAENGVDFVGGGSGGGGVGANATVRRVWLDIEDESPSKYYDADPAANQAFVAAVVARLQARRVPVGVYTTLTYWANIMDNAAGYSQYPLWYPRYDGVDSMDFFNPFAGWESVKIKQTAGSTGLCGLSQVDTDYME